MPPKEPTQFSGTAALAATQEQEPESWLKNMAALIQVSAIAVLPAVAASTLNSARPTGPAAKSHCPRC